MEDINSNSTLNRENIDSNKGFYWQSEAKNLRRNSQVFNKTDNDIPTSFKNQTLVERRNADSLQNSAERFRKKDELEKTFYPSSNEIGKRHIDLNDPSLSKTCSYRTRDLTDCSSRPYMRYENYSLSRRSQYYHSTPRYNSATIDLNKTLPRHDMLTRDIYKQSDKDLPFRIPSEAVLENVFK